MTYRELFACLAALSDEQLNMDVTIRDVQEDEYFAASSFKIETETDVLGENHPVINFV